MATTIAKVQEIITTEQSDTVIQSLIDSASSYLSQVLSSGVSTTVYNEIHRWLTAHMLAVAHDRQGKKETLGDAQVEFTGEFKQQLKSTTYGQMVLMLDYSGKIGNAPKKAVLFQALNEEDD